MPVTAIPFKSPPPFELPDHLIDSLAVLPFPDAVRQVLAILVDAQAAEALWTAFLDGEGCLKPGPHLATDAPTDAILEALGTELAARSLVVDSDAGRADYLAQAVIGAKPLLIMGEVSEAEPGAFPASLVRYLLGGQARLSLGFMYLFPLVDSSSGKAHGVLALHRPLAAGPLNHDQPAIANALVLELAMHANAGG